MSDDFDDDDDLGDDKKEPGDFDFPNEIVGLDEVSPHPNFLVFAKSGSGKSVWATSAKRVLVLNCEPEGLLSAKKMKSTAKQWKCPTFKDFLKAKEWLEECVRTGKKIPIDVLVVDSLTFLQKHLMRSIMDDVIAKKPTRDPDIPDQREYYLNQLKIQRYVKEINDLPFIVVWTCLAREETDPEGKAFMCPAIQGKGYEIAQLILAMMTSYGYMDVRYRKKDGKYVRDAKTNPIKDRYIYWEDVGTMQGKDRTCSLAPFTKNLTLQQCLDKIESEN